MFAIRKVQQGASILASTAAPNIKAPNYWQSVAINGLYSLFYVRFYSLFPTNHSKINHSPIASSSRLLKELK